MPGKHLKNGPISLPDPLPVDRLGTICRRLGLSPSSAHDGYRRGELVPATHTACGLPLFREADVLAWSQAERKMGPKPCRLLASDQATAVTHCGD